MKILPDGTLLAETDAEWTKLSRTHATARRVMNLTPPLKDRDDDRHLVEIAKAVRLAVVVGESTPTGTNLALPSSVRCCSCGRDAMFIHLSTDGTTAMCLTCARA